MLLAVKNMGGESEAAWRGVLDGLIARGLRTPEFLITARNTAYDRTCVRLSAGRVVLIFNNRDAGVGHSVTVYDPAGVKIISSTILTGPRVFSLNFRVATGIYQYRCDVHPRLMHGILLVT